MQLLMKGYSILFWKYEFLLQNIKRRTFYDFLSFITSKVFTSVMSKLYIISSYHSYLSINCIGVYVGDEIQFSNLVFSGPWHYSFILRVCISSPNLFTMSFTVFTPPDLYRSTPFQLYFDWTSIWPQFLSVTFLLLIFSLPLLGEGENSDLVWTGLCHSSLKIPTHF